MPATPSARSPSAIPQAPPARARRAARGSWRRALALLLQPVSAAKRSVLAARWQALSPELRTGWQVMGRQMVHCGYTLGPAYCSFGCTHCYLPRNANSAPLPTLAEMREQIDANARLLGDGGALQITGGDVVDAYWRAGRPQELVDVVRYAVDAGLVPMLMTHGQVLLEQPWLLDRLVLEGGLRKLALHIDVTQAGRPGFPIRSLTREADLNPLRQRFVELLGGCASRTGVRIKAAHTVTVTERNIDSLSDILGWLCADLERLRAFPMVSFQTEAAVGRTRASAHPVTPDQTRKRIAHALGVELSFDGWWVGHPDCSRWSTVLVDPQRQSVHELFTAAPAERRFVSHLLEVFGGVGSRGASDLEANAQRVGCLLRHPLVLLSAAHFARAVWRRCGLGPAYLARIARGRVAALNLVMHDFMGEEQVRGNDARTCARLDACAFRGAARRDGRWVAVPMCTMNADEREWIYARQIAGGRALVELRPPDLAVAPDASRPAAGESVAAARC